MTTATEARPFLWQRLEEGPQTLPEVIDLLIECGEEETALCRCLQWMREHDKWPEFEKRYFSWWRDRPNRNQASRLILEVFVHLPKDIDLWTGRKSVDAEIDFQIYRTFRDSVEALSIALEAMKS